MNYRSNKDTFQKANFEMMEKWSVGVLECWIQHNDGFLFFPLLQHSNTPNQIVMAY
jgi:hypothetical protein